MPEFTTVSVQEAKVQTTSGRQGQYLHEYIDYITKLPKGQAGRLRIGAEEKHNTIKRRLDIAAQTLGISLIIKRSGNDVYSGGKLAKRSSQDEGDGPEPGAPVALFTRICLSLSRQKTEEVCYPQRRYRAYRKQESRE